MLEFDAVLEDWYTDTTYRIIWGNIYDDTKMRFHDGQRIHTSSIPGWNPERYKEGVIVQTLNTKYLLGRPKNHETS